MEQFLHYSKNVCRLAHIRCTSLHTNSTHVVWSGSMVLWNASVYKIYCSRTIVPWTIFNLGSNRRSLREFYERFIGQSDCEFQLLSYCVNNESNHPPPPWATVIKFCTGNRKFIWTGLSYIHVQCCTYGVGKSFKFQSLLHLIQASSNISVCVSVRSPQTKTVVPRVGGNQGVARRRRARTHRHWRGNCQ